MRFFPAFTFRRASGLLRNPVTRGVMMVVVTLTALLGAAPAFAAAGPAWTISSLSQPTNFAPGSAGQDYYLVTATNSGSAPTDGSTITITDNLPAGIADPPPGFR